MDLELLHGAERQSHSARRRARVRPALGGKYSRQSAAEGDGAMPRKHTHWQRFTGEAESSVDSYVDMYVSLWF